MPITVCPPDHEPAATLLAEYFAERTAGFRAGTYRVTPPDPAAFTGADGVFLVAHDPDGAPLGCGGVRRIRPDDRGPRFELKHLYVRPAARGAGCGAGLLAALEARAARLGAHTLVLDTNASLTAAGALYRRSGYLPVPAYNENPNATDWYAKRLDDRP